MRRPFRRGLAPVKTISLGAMCLIAVLGHADPLTIRVRDNSGAGIGNALCTLYSPEGASIAQARSDDSGDAHFQNVARGSYRADVTTSGFAASQNQITIPAENDAVEVQLSIAPAVTAVSVSAERGSVDDDNRTPRFVTVRQGADFNTRPLVTIGAALDTAPGVLLQTSTYGQVSPTLRSLTGYQTLLLVDGIRFNTSIFRSGPNQYLSFIEPEQADAIEVVLGPSGAGYGSDALGGTVTVLTSPVRFDEAGRSMRGELSMLGASADASASLAGKVSVATPSFWPLGGLSTRKLQDLRTGQGLDSRNVFRRYFGMRLESIEDLLGSRLQDSGFNQYGGEAKLSWRLTKDQSITARFGRTEFDNLRSYRDKLGGVGRLVSDFSPQWGQLGYIRYERRFTGSSLDSITGAFSVNTQTDGNRRKGALASDPLVQDDMNVDAFGYAGQGTTHIGSNHVQVWGGDFYDEYIASISTQTDALTGIARMLRPILPNGSRYGLASAFGQNTSQWLGGKLRATGGIRFTSASFRSYARRNETPAGVPLGVADASERFSNWSYHTAGSWTASEWLTLHLVHGRGFRAPNVTDLATIGLSSLGYEIPISAATTAGALLSDSAGEAALSQGRTVSNLRAESMSNYEVGIAVRNSRFYGRVQGFWATFQDPIARRTLLFPANAAPAMLAGVPVTPIPQTPAQLAQGVVTVAPAVDSRAIKAFVNDGRDRYYGSEAVVRVRIRDNLQTETNWSYIFGRSLYPSRPLRRLSPQQGSASLRWFPSRQLWLEWRAVAAGPQTRLQAGDYDDERIGASRRRSDIASFFNSGFVQPFVQPNTGGTAVFGPTGETLRQIQDRVLPIGTTLNGVTVLNDTSRVPMLTSTAGYVSFDMNGSLRLRDWVRLNFGISNLFDRNYRVHGSGVDMPGFSVFLGTRMSF